MLPALCLIYLAAELMCVCVCVWLRFFDYVLDFVLAVNKCCAVLELVGLSKASLAMVGHD